MQGRDQRGRFGSKSKFGRVVKSIRADAQEWEEFGKMADTLGVTRADLLSQWINENRVIHGKSENKGVEILEEALKLKANAGGAIKKKIREYLEFHKNQEN